jgi:DNA-binding transcriptional MerR regulator
MKARSSATLPPIPDKLYFKIGEVGAIAKVATHVLRFWESQFPKIAPKRTASGQRLYTRKEVELILAIKDLLYRRKFTIEGARQHLRIQAGEEKIAALHVLEDLRAELEQLRRLLD